MAWVMTSKSGWLMLVAEDQARQTTTVDLGQMGATVYLEIGTKIANAKWEEKIGEVNEGE